MLIDSIEDSDLAAVQAGSYDASIFASGYEVRASFIAGKLEAARLGKISVVGFSTVADDIVRKTNDEFFRSAFGVLPKVIAGSDDIAIYSCLRDAESNAKSALKILVDYSAMSRLWYAAVLNWFRVASALETVDIDFVYAVGRHQTTLPPMVIDNVLCIPGCEGGALAHNRSVAIIGLGFDSLASLCVLDQMEPDLIYSFFAEQDAPDGYAARVQEENREIVSQAARSFGLPLTSVEQAFRYLAETIDPHRRSADVNLIPMGPKPHVLASILIAMRFPEVGCLRVSRRDRREDVVADGRVVCTRVRLSRKNPRSPARARTVNTGR